ncbi:MAG: hypothetical protein GY820_10485 [Gammaproteobacteria bacterium]|nr:hypothetical protein [Gammaproteobacteria bacterium]
MPEELTEEDVFANDVEPIEGIRQFRKEEGVAEEDLPERDGSSAAFGDIPEEKEAADEDDLKEFKDDGDKNTTEDTSADDSSEAQPYDGDQKTGDDSNDNGDEDEEDEEEAAPEIKTRSFKANGQDFNFTEEEMLGQFETVFGQAMDYTKKMQKIAPFRKMISAIEDQGITQDQLNLAIDALKGDKGAIQRILETHSIDSYDLDDDDNPTTYVPSDYGKGDKQLEIEEIAGKIQGDEEYGVTVNVIDEQWDDASRETINANPNMILGLHNDIKTGVYDKVSPVAMKMKVLDGNSKSDIEYYMLAGQQLQAAATAQKGPSAEELNAGAQAADSKFEAESSEARRKRAASSTGSRADRKGVIDYLDDDDEKFDEWYKKLQSSV